MLCAVVCRDAADRLFWMSMGARVNLIFHGIG